MNTPTRWALCAVAALFMAGSAAAQEAAIRKALTERLPNLPKIDEITRSPIPGLYEVRMGTEILYSDEQGNFLVSGELIDTRTRAVQTLVQEWQNERDKP